MLFSSNDTTPVYKRPFPSATRIKRGRRPDDALKTLRKFHAVQLYDKYLAWLQKRKRRYKTLDEFKGLEKADWWSGPPYERAARMAVRALGRGGYTFSWKHVLNLARCR